MPRVIHFDVPADDPERASRFYREVFGWTIQKWDGPTDYWLATTGPSGEPGIDGGIGRRRYAGESPLFTIGVESVEEFVDKIKAAGGKILLEKTAVPGVGWLASCMDSEDNRFAIMQDDPGAA